MRIRKMLLMIGAVVFFASTVLAQPIEVDFHSLKGSWSWAGKTTSLMAKFDEVDIIYGSTEVEVNGSETFKLDTGKYISGKGTQTDPFVFDFDALAPTSITLTGCVTGPKCKPDVTLFSGSFTADVTGYNAKGLTLHLDASSLAGTMDPSVYAVLGIPAGTPLTVIGSLNVNLAEKKLVTVARGGSGKGGGGDMLVVPTPEPGSLSLLFIGLAGIVGPLAGRKAKET